MINWLATKLTSRLSTMSAVLSSDQRIVNVFNLELIERYGGRPEFYCLIADVPDSDKDRPESIRSFAAAQDRWRNCTENRNKIGRTNAPRRIGSGASHDRRAAAGSISTKAELKLHSRIAYIACINGEHAARRLRILAITAFCKRDSEFNEKIPRATYAAANVKSI